MIKSLFFILLFNATIVPLSSASDNEESIPQATQDKLPALPSSTLEKSHEKKYAQNESEQPKLLTPSQKAWYYVDRYGPWVVMTIAGVVFLYYYHETAKNIETLKRENNDLHTANKQLLDPKYKDAVDAIVTFNKRQKAINLMNKYKNETDKLTRENILLQNIVDLISQENISLTNKIK
jgi:hypothetical protein